MFIIILYGIVMFAASFTGSLAGLGGGIIIKQALDAIAYHDTVTIGYYASIAIFAMAIMAIYKQMRTGFKFKWRIVFLISFGSLVGGYIGERAFMALAFGRDNGTVKGIQAVLLAITLIAILYFELNKETIRHYRIKHPVPVFSTGFFLGFISIFLGIGGGPLNLTLLVWLFSFNLKEAVSYSIATVFFAQIAKLGTIYISGNVLAFSFPFMITIIIFSIIGGYVGTALKNIVSDRYIARIFQILVAVLLLLSFYNAYMGFTA